MCAAMFVLSLLISLTASGQQVTYGPILGRLSHQGARTWLGTDRPGDFHVRYGTDRRRQRFSSAVEQTQLVRNNIGWVDLPGLRADTRYFYQVAISKDDAWTVFLDEREQRIQFRDKLDKSIWLLTGDLHSSFAIRITDRIRGFVSGSHNSNHHWYSDEGVGPASRPFQFGPRARDIPWSTFFLNDIPFQNSQYPTCCIVQINNVIDNPKELDQSRWVAFPWPQLMFQDYLGMTGKLLYAESIVATF
ncbi:MAG: fibronectin type III domain-containing protein [Planctomycetota bacterium]|nr:fibronectin type III domain-containing protein [Planctomycetota bacterium]